MESLHGGDDIFPGGVFDGVVREDLVANEEEAEEDGGAKWRELLGDPFVGKGLILSGYRDKRIGQHDGDFKFCAGESGEDFWVGVVDLDARGIDRFQEFDGCGG